MRIAFGSWLLSWHRQRRDAPSSLALTDTRSTRPVLAAAGRRVEAAARPADRRAKTPAPAQPVARRARRAAPQGPAGRAAAKAVQVAQRVAPEARRVAPEARRAARVAR